MVRMDFEYQSIIAAEHICAVTRLDFIDPRYIAQQIYVIFGQAIVGLHLQIH
ncbi:hypothetical protein D3C78_1048650 [compost metagenome]